MIDTVGKGVCSMCGSEAHVVTEKFGKKIKTTTKCMTGCKQRKVVTKYVGDAKQV